MQATCTYLSAEKSKHKVGYKSEWKAQFHGHFHIYVEEGTIPDSQSQVSRNKLGYRVGLLLGVVMVMNSNH